MKPYRSALPSLLGIVMVLALVPAQAQTQNPKLLFTELSSTMLTATLDGTPIGTVNNLGPDHWEWRSGILGAGAAQGNVPVMGAFVSAEPAGETGVNFLLLKFFDVSAPRAEAGFDITSETSGWDQYAAANGNYAGTYYVQDIPPTGGQGFDVFGPVDVYFMDLGDVSPVPEGASTLALLTLSSVLMLGAFRVHIARAA